MMPTPARTGPTRGRSTRRWLLAGVTALLLLGLAGGETIGATSDRSLVPASRLTDRPFRSLVLVSVGNSVVCTGFVVAPRKVVTAAHCLVRNAARGNFRFRTDLPGSIRLYRAYSRIHGGSPYRSCGVSRAWAHSRFIKRDKTDRLFGLPNDG